VRTYTIVAYCVIISYN